MKKKFKKYKWIPRKLYFQMKADGGLPWQDGKPGKVKTKRRRRVKTKGKTKKTRAASRKGKGARGTKNKVNKILKTFIIYVKGEEMEEMKGYSDFQVQKDAEKKYNSKKILLEEIK